MNPPEGNILAGQVHTTVQERLNRDLNASIQAWSHLAARGLGSELVWTTLFAKFGLTRGGER